MLGDIDIPVSCALPLGCVDMERRSWPHVACT